MTKQRLKDILPSCVTFLDVDDLKAGMGAESAAASSTCLVFCARKYFASRSCAVELLCAVGHRKPIIAVLESEERHGAITVDEIRALLTDEWAAKWNLERNMAALGFEQYTPPTGEELSNALFAGPVIEWNRFAAFQVTRLLLSLRRVWPPARLTARCVRVLCGGRV